MQINVCLNDNSVRIYVYIHLNTQLARMETKYQNLLYGLRLCILSVSCPVA